MNLAFWLSLGKGVLGGLRKIPWQVYAVLLVLVAFWLFGQYRYRAGVTDTNASWQAAQAKADKDAKVKEKKRDDVSIRIEASTTEKATQDVAKTRKETSAAVERVKYVTRTIRIPADCPALPASVQREGSSAVDRANAANRSLRTGQH